MTVLWLGSRQRIRLASSLQENADTRPTIAATRATRILYTDYAGFPGDPQQESCYVHTLFHAHRNGRVVMAYRSGYGRGRPAPPTPGTVLPQAYKLVTIEPARTPEGCVGPNWFLYRIAQGKNMITGHRQGELLATTAEVHRIVLGLNERHIATKGRPGPKPKAAASTAAAAAPVTPPPEADAGAATTDSDLSA